MQTAVLGTKRALGTIVHLCEFHEFGIVVDSAKRCPTQQREGF